MKIDPNKCVACGNCTYVCPMGAIYIDPVIKRATVNATECVECYACFNGLSQEHLNPTMVRTMRKLFQWMRLRFDPEPDVCPTAAFAPDELTWPRVVRRAFSDPRVPHESTGVEGLVNHGANSVSIEAPPAHRAQYRRAALRVAAGARRVGDPR